jgi:hypothetical protein
MTNALLALMSGFVGGAIVGVARQWLTVCSSRREIKRRAARALRRYETAKDPRPGEPLTPND